MQCSLHVWWKAGAGGAKRRLLESVYNISSDYFESLLLIVTYRDGVKIRRYNLNSNCKVSLGSFVFGVMSLGGLYLEGLIHGGAYFRNFTVLEI